MNINQNNTTYSRYLIKYTRVCENGVWSEVETDCDTLLIDNGLMDNNNNKENSFPILTTMSVALLVCCLLCIICYYILKLKKKKKQQVNDKKTHPLVDKCNEPNRNRSSLSSNRISDPSDDSVYAMVAEERYEIINFDGNNLDLSDQYDDVETSTPFYLEIMPMKDISSERNSQRISS